MAAANGTFKVILAILALALLSLALLHYYEYTFHSNTSSKSSSSNNGRRKNDHLDTVENGGGKLSTLRRSVKVTFKDQNVDRVVKPKARDQQQQQQQRSPSDMADEKPGQLICNGKRRVTEIVYWKNISSDALYESPVTPHHGVHHDKYLTFEYDNGGWNNMRMGIECLLVAAHAMGRTFVVPPQQHLYLISMNHKDAHDVKPHDEMGFEDMYDVELLKSHSGLHIIHMEEFLAKEGVTGGLNGMLPPDNSTDAWGMQLWKYLDKAADVSPEWMGSILVFPDKTITNSSFAKLHENRLHNAYNSEAIARFDNFTNGRQAVYYDNNLQSAHHIHVPGDSSHRILQHHYAFAFFVDKEMQSFYKRFVRDFMRYKDDIQCAGADLVDAIRADARKADARNVDGVYYALHVRRGDFQFKDVKLSADQIVRNLVGGDGQPLIPRGALVYLSTDDPGGVCKNCLVNRKPCESYPTGAKPVGCQEDPSWNAFVFKAGWTLRFLHNYTTAIKSVNPNKLGMIESIVCSRARRFAGTYYSTFTGYIHRLRGYHGLGEETYYHSNGFLNAARAEKSKGSGFSREFRDGWVDDEFGELI